MEWVGKSAILIIFVLILVIYYFEERYPWKSKVEVGEYKNGIKNGRMTKYER